VPGHDLSRIFKAYDVRGVVPDDLDADLARRIGQAFADWTGLEKIVLGRDCRLSSPELAAAIEEGATSRGVDVVDLGLASTDLLYFASGSLDLPGVMLTASHNPKQYNGLKFCMPGARPVGEESGLREIRALVDADEPTPVAARGTVESRDLLDAYADHVLGFVDVGAMRPLTVVADTANGMGGLVAPAVLSRLPVTLHHLYAELDGTFPNHPADPIQPANQLDLQARVVSGGFDVGLAFDGDADRVFVVDEAGRGLSGSTTTAMLAVGMLAKFPGATILHNLICSRAVPEVVREHGGVPIRTKVGHSYIKQIMAESGAVFGGEHSAHYYFRDNYRADSGIIATVLVLEQLSHAGVPLSTARKPFERYAASGEINTAVADPAAVLERVAGAYASSPQDRLDGLTVDAGRWWFNLRPSNTEPLLRLNLEADDREACDQRVAEVLALITQP
jgi:phosphomannomutase